MTQAARSLQTSLGTIERVLPANEGAWLYDPATQHTALDVLRAEVASLRVLSETLHALAPLHAGKPLRWLESVELGDVLMSILPRWKTRAPQTLLELALPGEVPTVLAESALVERAVDALIAYMVTHAPPGDTIRVSIRPRPDHVLVSLRHHGRPLPAEALATLFEPDAVAQVGLLLALARAIVEAHGGRVWAELPETGGGVTLCAAWPMLPPGNGIAKEALREDEPASGRSALANRSAAALATQPTRDPSLPLHPARTRSLALVAHLDARMTRYLRANLEEDLCESVAAASIGEALRVIERDEPDVVLLDGHLCGANFEGLTAVRDATSAPVFVLPRRANPGASARMLDLGARDVLASPFAMEELLARTRAALRERVAARAEEANGLHLMLGELEIDLGERKVCRAGRRIALSKTEFKLLRVLAQHAGMVLAHDALLEQVWGPAYSREVGFIWVYVRRLRRKIEPDPAHPRYILTVPGVGYRLVRAEEVSDLAELDTGD